MPKFDGGIIHPTARYRTQTSSQSRGIYTMQEQYLHRANTKWDSPLEIYPDNAGKRVPVTLTTVASGSADDTSDFNVYHNEFDSALGVKTTGRIYLAIKVTANTTYLNDFCIGGVQIMSGNHGSVEQIWAFDTLSDYTAWQYATVTGIGDAADSGYENYTDIIEADSQTWNTNVNSSANGRISRGTSTNSSGTGAADGFSTLAWENMDDETTVIEQESGDYYMFTETSGSNIANKWLWTRSPEFTLSASNCHILIAYHAASPATVGMTDSSGEPLFRWWWV
tara:strand:+ start:1636 stop:2478 length:843 start_codon:yes stop_codon:yes gene_type:complete